MLPSLWILPYLLLLVSGVTIPSDGGHGLLNVKSIAFLGTFAAWGLYIVLKQNLSLYQLKIILFFIGSMLFLYAWMLLGLVYDHTYWESQIDQFKVFFITIVFVAVTLYWESEGVLTFEKFFKTMVYANFFYSFCKVTLVILHVVGVINMFSLLSSIGLRFMSMNILGNLSRMQTSVDIVAPFLLFFVLQSKRFGILFPKGFKTTFVILSTFAIFLSFSRFMLAVGALSFLLYITTLHVKKIINALLGLITLSILALAVIGPDNVAEMIEKRFFSNETAVSDQTRIIQIKALMREYDQFPLLGKGLGGYTKESIRDEKLMHSYEVQWAAFLMQFGFFGLLTLIVPSLFIIFQTISQPNSRFRWSLLLLFALWLLAGFTNPFLISLTSGIIYSLFFLTTEAKSQREMQDKFFITLSRG